MEFTAGFAQTMDLTQHGFLVGGQVDHEVGHRHLEAGGLEAQLIQPLDVAEAGFDVVAREAEGQPMMLAVCLGHVEANHLPVLAHQLRQSVDVATRATAQIQHFQTVEQRRVDQATARIACGHFAVDARQQWLQSHRHLAGVAAGGRAQVCGAFQLIAVLVLDQFMHVQTSFLPCTTGQPLARQAVMPPWITRAS